MSGLAGYRKRSRQNRPGEHSRHVAPHAGSALWGQTYPPEFKFQAVKLVLEQKLSVAEVARQLGISANLLQLWKKAFLAHVPLDDQGHPCGRPQFVVPPVGFGSLKQEGFEFPELIVGQAGVGSGRLLGRQLHLERWVEMQKAK